MESKTGVYRVQAFAELAGVTVRALHHYDRLGLLKPSHRTDRGYRLYSDHDLGRLEQIVVLKFLGLPLKQIRALLQSDAALAETLRRQQVVLAEKRQSLDSAIRAIGAAERSLRSQATPDWTLFKRIIKEIEMQNDTEWSKKYYSPEAQAKVEARKHLWSPELQEKVTKQWSAMYADVEAAITAGEKPDGTTAQALAARWKELVAGFTGGDPEIQKGLNKMWADQADWPAPQKQQYQINPEIQSFITAAMKHMSGK